MKRPKPAQPASPPAAAIPQWPADRVERWPVGKLTPYARNARTHSDEQIAQIAGAIREWGWTVPVLVDEQGGLIAGHGRVLAARQLELAEIPVMVARGWSEAQKRAYVLADNKLALNAGWNEELLRIEIADLQGMGIGLSLIGFTEDEVKALSDRGGGLTDPDDTPPLESQAISAAGDVWLLGRHRLVCGDYSLSAGANWRGAEGQNVGIGGLLGPPARAHQPIRPHHQATCCQPLEGSPDRPLAASDVIGNRRLRWIEAAVGAQPLQHRMADILVQRRELAGSSVHVQSGTPDGAALATHRQAWAVAIDAPAVPWAWVCIGHSCSFLG